MKYIDSFIDFLLQILVSVLGSVIWYYLLNGEFPKRKEQPLRQPKKRYKPLDIDQVFANQVSSLPPVKLVYAPPHRPNKEVLTSSSVAARQSKNHSVLTTSKALEAAQNHIDLLNRVVGPTNNLRIHRKLKLQSGFYIMH